MLEIFNTLKPFFNDVYKEISVREFSRLINVSPPTASKLLTQYQQENLLVKQTKGIYMYYKANRESELFIGLSKLYWQTILKKETQHIHEDALYKSIILFGSLSKAENTSESDIDLFIDCTKRTISTGHLEEMFKRKIQLHFHDALNNPHLKKNIEKGIALW